MELFVLGTSHCIASAEIRERMHIGSGRVREGLEALTGPGRLLEESVFLSTCARYEVYGVADEPQRAVAVLERLIALETGLSREHLRAHSYTKIGPDAGEHLLRVASGLESAVQGEAQILGQVKNTQGGDHSPVTMGATLQRLFQTAIATGKRVRSETDIGRGAASLAAASIQLLEGRHGTLVGQAVLVVGAGETGDLVTRLLRKAGVETFYVVNRSPEPAEALAATVGGTAHGLDAIPELLTRVQMVVGAAASPTRLVDATLLAALRKEGRDVPEIFLDLAHPRNFDPDVDQVCGVDLLDLQVVHDRVTEAREARSAQVPKAEAIVAEELSAFQDWLKARGAVPVVRAVRRRVIDMASAEADKFCRGLDGDQREAVQTFARSFARSLLHQPTVALRSVDSSTTDGQQFLEQVGSLFGVEPDQP
jgi:glutamyl-tRNA reductase